MRPTREDIHMRTALLWAQRSLCKQPNRKIGCVLTDIDMRRVLSIGYNGPARLLPNDSCRNIPGNCGCLHAEQNAIALCTSREPKIAFITMEPCEQCAQLLIQANVVKVYYLDSYRTHVGLEVLSTAGRRVVQLRLDDVADEPLLKANDLNHWLIARLSKERPGLDRDFRQHLRSLVREYFAGT